jgi:pyruvate ferredoxin oxidoreductase gamma subunit
MIVCCNRWYSDGYSLVLLQARDFFRNVYLLRRYVRGAGGKKMKNDMVEIRWHGRGGQGTKTACLLLADVAFNSGKYVQGFPEYGPERMGAPMTAYNRVSDKECKVHSNIYDPNYVVVVDETLIHSVDVTSGIKKGGALIVNTDKCPDEVRKMVPGFKEKIYTIDAKRISEENLGRNFPNTPMLAATVVVSKVIDEEQFIKDMKTSFKHKFADKPQVIEGNMKTLIKSMKEVKAV